MKYIAPIVLALAALLTVTGLFVRQRDPALVYTDVPEAWRAYEDGNRLLHSFRHSEADTLLSYAVRLDYRLAPAHAALGELNLRLGQAARAARHLAVADSLAEALTDRRARLLVQVRLAGFKESRHHAARDSLLDLAQLLAPHEVVVLSGIALRATEAGDLELAETAWQQILRHNPNYASAYNHLGYLHLNRGAYAEAEAAMRRYAFVAPDLANPHDSLGEVLMATGRYEEAEEELLVAMKKQVDFPYPLMNLAYIHLARGEVPKAVDLIENVLQVLAGTTLELGFQRTVIHRLSAHRLTDLVEDYAARYLTREVDPRLRALVRSQQLLARGEALAALAHLDSLQADHETAPWYPGVPHIDQQVRYALLSQRGLAAGQLGLHEPAADLLRQALAAGRHFPPHLLLVDHVHLADNLVALGELDEARQHIGQALAVNPRLAEGILVATRIEAAAGNFAEARRLLVTLEQILVRAVSDHPARLGARRLQELLPDPDHI